MRTKNLYRQPGKRNLNKLKAANSLIFLTYRCTSRCKACNIWKWDKSPASELSWQEWDRALNKLKDFGIKTVEIFGGDALLRKDVIFKMIEFCSKNNIKAYFPTNSILLDEETANTLVQSGLHTLYFSLDGVGINNDKIRGVDDNFSKIKNALENVINARGSSKTPKIIICATISKMNYNHFKDIVEFLSGYPVDAIYPRVLAEFTQANIDCSVVDGIKPEPFFVSTENGSHKLSVDELTQFKMTVDELRKIRKNSATYINFRAYYDTEDNIILGLGSGIKRCLLCSTLLTINPNGDVIPCLFFKNYIMGNLLSDCLGKIWGNGKHKKFIELQKEGEIKICGECVSRIYYPSLLSSISYYKKRLLQKLNIDN